MVTLKLYRYNFDVTAYYSGTNRIVRPYHNVVPTGFCDGRIVRFYHNVVPTGLLAEVSSLYS